jgi:transporter family-2 protein
MACAMSREELGGISMDRNLAVVLAVAAGGCFTLQALVNSTLGKDIESFQAAMVSGAGAALVLACVSLVTGGGFVHLGAHPVAWHYIGGLLGAVFLTTTLLAVRTLGAGGMTAALIAGQLALSTLVDHFGLLGVRHDPVSAARLLGLALLVGGVTLVVRS